MNLTALREHAGLTQSQVAVALGVSQPRVSQIEHSALGALEFATVLRFVEALGATMLVSIAFPGEDDYVLYRTPT